VPETGPKAKDQINLTDEESRIMPSVDGFIQGYNTQAADVDTMLIIATTHQRQAENRLKTQRGRALYGKRKSTVEPVLGIIKQGQGFRQFSLRGLDAVAGEWKLVTMAFNLKRVQVGVGSKIAGKAPRNQTWLTEPMLSTAISM
jgi:hypothetical protein